MFSLARSRYTLPSQLIFAAIHALGLALGIAYNSNTPDLYPNNAHHKLGWIVTVVIGGHIVHSLLSRVAGPLRRALGGSDAHADQELRTFIPMTTSAMVEHQRLQAGQVHPLNRHSNDSGHGTDRTAESMRSNSVSIIAEEADAALEEGRKSSDEDDDVFKDVAVGSGRGRRWHRGYDGKVAARFSSWCLRVFSIWFLVIDRLILPLGFITLCTGIATYGRFFVSFDPGGTEHLAEWWDDKI
jgi:hypothetical protein